MSETSIAKETTTDEQSKDTRTGLARLVPRWLSDNATRITNTGLMIFTGIMLHSGYKGKKISEEMYKHQVADIKAGVQSELNLGKIAAGGVEAREAKVLQEALQNKLIKKPGWHKMRLVYLLTAMTSFAFGAFFKRKEETPEELNKYAHMPLHEYMAMRTGQAFDPVNHSRQTVGLLSGTSGVMAIVSALSQPGGIHRSELFVGTTLAAGGMLLGFINDPKVAQNVFSTLWMMRVPAIFSGTRESVFLHPHYQNGYLNELKKTPEFLAGKSNAFNDGYKENIPGLMGFNTTMYIDPAKGFMGIGKDRRVDRIGEKAAKAFEQEFGKAKTDVHPLTGKKRPVTFHPLPERRNDIAYPIGQWGNLASAFVGYFADKSEPAKAKPAVNPENPDLNSDGQVIAKVENLPNTPVAQVSKPQHAERLQEQRGASAELAVTSRTA